jgi:hypothetical protein
MTSVRNLYVLSLVALPACGVFSSSDDGPTQANELVSWVERVYVECESSRQKVAAALAALQSIAAGSFQGDAIAAHRILTDAIQRSEEQATRLSSTIAPMKHSAESLFTRWAEDLKAFQDDNLRRRSESRMRATQDRYQAVVKVADPALAHYEGFNRTLRDHSLFLGNDLNSSAVADLRADMMGVARAAGDLDNRLQHSLSASLAYVKAAGMLPQSAAPDATPAAPDAGR